MKLKFIGTDGSMGLRNGHVYKVNIRSNDKYIILFIEKNFWHSMECPYGLPQAFANNWSLE